MLLFIFCTYLCAIVTVLPLNILFIHTYQYIYIYLREFMHTYTYIYTLMLIHTYNYTYIYPVTCCLTDRLCSSSCKGFRAVYPGEWCVCVIYMQCISMYVCIQYLYVCGLPYLILLCMCVYAHAMYIILCTTIYNYNSYTKLFGHI